MAGEPVCIFDLTPLRKANFQDERERRNYWDELQLATALQGLVNRDHANLFVRYLDEDDFWWTEMQKPPSWLENRELVKIPTLDDLLRQFRNAYKGIVIWDERVPASANIAASVAGMDNLLPVRFDPGSNSLYSRLIAANTHADFVRFKLPEFTGAGMIPGTQIPSTGSAKCDAYRWLIETRVKTDKANPLCMGYCLDAFWFKCWRASSPENNAVCNEDYMISRRGVIFDLDIWDDEAPVDDPGQKPGTDAATLKEILRAAYNRVQGNAIIDVIGFVPWAYKYTKHRSPEWFAGGAHEEVASEWRCSEILSCFNACVDADALALNAMPNASFYQHFPLTNKYWQNPKPTAETLRSEGFIGANGQIAAKTFVGFYVGDYDSAAWLYHELPKLWSDPERGKVPLTWCFNPNLAQRFPVALAWTRQTRTTNDWFAAGDSGAGYLNPGFLTPPRPWSSLPSGLDAWSQRCSKFYQQWDITLTGFIINGFARGLSAEGLDAYARFSPDGIITQGGKKSIHGGMPILAMASDVTENDPAEAARHILNLAQGEGPHFLACRTILKSPAWHLKVAQELHHLRGNAVQVIDLCTLLQLVKESESKRP